MISTFPAPGVGIPAFPPAVTFMPIKAGQVIVLDGDSVTAGYPNPPNRWSILFESTIAAQFAAAGKTAPSIVNTAVSGRDSGQTLAAVATPVAANPDHVFLLSSVNDVGHAIAPATTQANHTAYYNAILAARPGCWLHILANLFLADENWPDGAGTNDTAMQATNAAIKAAVALQPRAEYIDIRQPIFAVDAPTWNPTHLTSGVLTFDGTHPGSTGQTVISTRVLNRVSYDFR